MVQSSGFGRTLLTASRLVSNLWALLMAENMAPATQIGIESVLLLQ